MRTLGLFLRGVFCPLTLLLALLFSVTGCNERPSAAQARTLKTIPTPCSLALIAPTTNTALDQEILHWQEKARTPKPEVRQLSLEQLGWKYIEKAHATYDPGYYKLAEACAVCLQLDKAQPMPEAMLLRGHALHQMHQFKEAEPIARDLVKARGLSFDHGLLGDVLMEQGKLKEAITAYQEMMNQKPNLQAYSRAAHIRWLMGDVKGAAEIAQMAAQAGSPQDSISTAWAFSRFALYAWQLGQQDQAQKALRIALSIQPDYAPALLVKGRMCLAESKIDEALTVLKQAAALNPLPEYQWALAEALHAAGNPEEASKVEAELVANGHQNDPRTLSIYLATKHISTEKALLLAQQELAVRTDVFTYDALAWASCAAGKMTEAQTAIKQALAAGTKDARVFYHAGVIAASTGNKSDAHHYFKLANANRQMLWPSERASLLKQMPAT